MGWVEFKSNPPQGDCLCVVMNEKCPWRYLFAIYQKSYDEFKERDYYKTLDFPLEVTHYLVVPDWKNPPKACI